MTVYFNENDKFAAQWLRNLYPKAHVDDRSIQQVAAADLAGFERCHFFGGVGGWEYALQLAGFDGPCWTGSCPCQSVSGAGQRAGEKDERHLWPEFHRLIDERRPAIIFGEQVTSGDGREWLDGISLDLEALDYAVGASDLCAASQGAPHPRQRIFWGARQLGNANGARLGARRRSQRSQRSGSIEQMPAKRIAAGRLGEPDSAGPQPRRTRPTANGHRSATVAASRAGGLSDAGGTELAGREIESAREECQAIAGSLGASGLGLTIGDGQRGEWAADGRAPETPWASEVVYCRDDKYRRVSIEPSAFPLAHGIPTRRGDPRMGPCIAELERLGYSTKGAKQLLRSARSNRVGRLRGYGNAIVPQVAAVFIEAFMEAAGVGARGGCV